jgi:alanyl-tRNA synthetase
LLIKQRFFRIISAMNAQELRRKYLDFFSNKGHVIIPSSSLVPENDSSTLFTGSGMQPMVPYLLGEIHPNGNRLADAQKSFRGEDIEEVGDNRHTTFFEMLGNWSLGDYFKKEQIPWIFEFLTSVVGLDPNNLYVSVFRGNDEIGIPRDEETVELWQECFGKAGIEAKAVDYPERDGMKEGRIFYYDENKNWWSRSGVPSNMPVGEPGGPDSEMFWDFGAELKLHENSTFQNQPCHINCDCGRFMEIGNNVFMEYQKTENGFKKLIQRNVDFGGGLERLAAASLNNPDIFFITILYPLITKIESLSGKKYREDETTTESFRVLADHIRAGVMIIADGVEPSNKDRGYILRRLLRRSMVHARRLNLSGNWSEALVSEVVQIYKDSYPDLVNDSQRIFKTIESEQIKFGKTLEKGLKEFEKIMQKGDGISGEQAFNLYQTYGFPWELTKELAERSGILLVGMAAGFESEFKKHQDLSRTASAGDFKGGLADNSEIVVRYHTATHLMHKALRDVLGPDVWQKGSNITAERTRFDFTYPQKMTDEQKANVERLVNQWINQDGVVKREMMSLDEARQLGAIGLFGEKYGDTVSIYTITDPKTGEIISREFCGGPHVEHTGTIGKFKIAKEEAVSAGVRRIKAVLE